MLLGLLGKVNNWHIIFGYLAGHLAWLASSCRTSIFSPSAEDEAKLPHRRRPVLSHEYGLRIANISVSLQNLMLVKVMEHLAGGTAYTNRRGIVDGQDCCFGGILAATTPFRRTGKRRREVVEDRGH